MTQYLVALVPDDLADPNELNINMFTITTATNPDDAIKFAYPEIPSNIDRAVVIEYKTIWAKALKPEAAFV